MDSFRLGEEIQHTKLDVTGVVTDEVILVKHIGNLLVRQVRVQVKLGVEQFNLEWLVENVRPVLPALPTIMATV
jgi:hypothetical protein